MLLPTQQRILPWAPRLKNDFRETFPEQRMIFSMCTDGDVELKSIPTALLLVIDLHQR